MITIPAINNNHDTPLPPYARANSQNPPTHLTQLPCLRQPFPDLASRAVRPRLRHRRLQPRERGKRLAPCRLPPGIRRRVRQRCPRSCLLCRCLLCPDHGPRSRQCGVQARHRHQRPPSHVLRRRDGGDEREDIASGGARLEGGGGGVDVGGHGGGGTQVLQPVEESDGCLTNSVID